MLANIILSVNKENTIIYKCFRFESMKWTGNLMEFDINVFNPF